LLTQLGPQIGLGLGLYISHEIVTRHGGCIWAESTPDAGSAFSFALPLALVAPRLQPAHERAGSAYA
jgi:signal transduction histidine kinase